MVNFMLVFQCFLEESEPEGVSTEKCGGILIFQRVWFSNITKHL
jgi:hypothetical protein